MSDRSGRIELERSVDSITIGVRHRVEMGDLEPLMTSIERIGLVHPVTITPDGILVCGRRRLEAVKKLGWRTMRVWVRSGLSDRLTHLLAQQDENALRKPLSAVEATALYRELKKVIAEDAAARQEPTRFGVADGFGEMSGAAESATFRRGTGDARREASQLVTQSASYNRLEQVSALEKIASGDSQPAGIRQLAQNELRKINDGSPVNPGYQRVKAAIDMLARSGDNGDDAAADSEDLDAVATEALARAKDERAQRALENRRKKTASDGRAGRSLRSFILTWGDLDGWSAHYNAEEVATSLRDDQWELFKRVLAETQAFAAAGDAARAQAHQPTAA